MKLYKCIVKMGHAGSGRFTERPLYVWAPDALAAMRKAKRKAGVKKGKMQKNGGSVLKVELVNR